jgi:C-terminal processing protease CtpA/Prc
MTSDPARSHIHRSLSGSKVEFTIQRTPDKSSIKKITGEPRLYKPNDMFLEAMRKSAAIVRKDGRRIAFVHVWSFAGERYYELLRELVGSTLKEGEALVLDLRGGYGKVVGSRTAGALRAGRPFFLSDGSLLYLAVASCTANGEDLEGKGVEPDVKVDRPLPYCAGKDPQLLKAVEAAVGEIGK